MVKNFQTKVLLIKQVFDHVITRAWKNFRGWKVLELFLKTEGEFHVREVARRLKISSQTASRYLKLYESLKVLEKQKKANAVMYSLADNAAVRALKTFYIVDFIYPAVMEFVKINKPVSVALFGSCASGTYDRSSDIDLLVISTRKKMNVEPLKKAEKELDREISITLISPGKWKKIKEVGDEFSKSVIKKHILLYGAEL